MWHNANKALLRALPFLTAIVLTLEHQPAFAQVQLALDSNTVLLYHFNEADTAIDYSSFHHDGRLVNASRRDSAICNDTSIVLLAGSHSYIAVPITPELKFAGDFTLEAIVRLRKASESMPVSSNEDVVISTLCGVTQDGGYQISFKRLPNDSIGLFVTTRGSSPTVYDLVRPVFAPTDQPGCAHIAATFRKIELGARTEVRIYLNGAFIKTDTTVQSITYSSVDSLRLGVNTTDYGISRGFDGILCEVRISKIARSLANLLNCEMCGDANSSCSVSISDVVYLINYIFAGGPAPDPVLAGDANCSGAISISDAVYLINYIFGGGAAPCAACP